MPRLLNRLEALRGLCIDRLTRMNGLQDRRGRAIDWVIFVDTSGRAFKRLGLALLMCG